MNNIPDKIEFDTLQAALDWANDLIRQGAHVYRAARCDNPKEMLAFADQDANGCCGSFEQVLDCNVIVGFNYGH